MRAWLHQTADEMAAQGRYTPAQALDEISNYLRFIIHQLESLDPLCWRRLIGDTLNIYEPRCVKSAISWLSTDGSFKDRLISLAQQLAARYKTKGKIGYRRRCSQFSNHARSPTPITIVFILHPPAALPSPPNRSLLPTLDPAMVRNLRAGDSTAHGAGHHPGQNPALCQSIF